MDGDIDELRSIPHRLQHSESQKSPITTGRSYAVRIAPHDFIGHSCRGLITQLVVVRPAPGTLLQQSSAFFRI
jgi:hypothetical protein